MPESNDMVEVTRKDFEELKRLYGEAKAGEVFIFKGREVLKEYAGYMIEYIENKLGGTQ